MMRLYQTPANQLSIFGLMLCFALLIDACATFEQPEIIDETPVRERALTQTAVSVGIQASVAVVGDEEAEEIFGIDLARKKIQAVWLEIRNNTDKTLILLPTAIDPNYFTPLEVAFVYHKWFAKDANAALDEHLLSLNFPIRNLIMPETRASGYIFTTWTKGSKVIDVDLAGDDISQNFTFFASGPGTQEARAVFDIAGKMFSDDELHSVTSETALRQTLMRLPCCVSSLRSGDPGEPLNVVFISTLDDLTTAMMRRGYRYQPLNPRYAFGRAQDFSGRKLSRGYIQAQTHSVRLWKTPIVFKGKPVWIGQTSNRRGGRFAAKAAAEVTLPIDPHVDEARYDLTQDLAYSQALVKIGYVKGAERLTRPKEAEAPDYIHYTTDGLRAVLVLGDRPASLKTIDFFDWERPADIDSNQ